MEDFTTALLEGVMDVGDKPEKEDVKEEPKKKPKEEPKKKPKEPTEESKKLFSRIDVTVLEQSDEENEFFELSKVESIRSETHLSQALAKCVKEAMAKIEKPFDSVDVLFRRSPIEEKKTSEMRASSIKPRDFLQLHLGKMISASGGMTEGAIVRAAQEDEVLKVWPESSISGMIQEMLKEGLLQIDKDMVLTITEEDMDIFSQLAEKVKEANKELTPQEKAECELLAAEKLFSEKKVDEKFLKGKAEAAAKAGTLWDRMKDLFLSKKSQKVCEKIFEDIKLVWPAKELANNTGKQVVVDSIWNDRWEGKLAKAGEGKYKITTRSGDKIFGPSDVKRILVRTGGKK